MSPFVIGIIGFLLMFILMALGLPIAFAMALTGVLGLFILEGSTVSLATLGMTPFSWASDHGLMCVPLFILMGHFANKAGLITSAYEAAYKWVGRWPGGLAISSTLGSGAFGAVSGSSSAASATMATICIPEMEKYGYAPKLMTGSVAIGGTFAILIPPSLGMILYGVITEESIGKLFIAGILPGILMVFAVCLAIYIMCRVNPRLGAPGPSTSFREKISSLTRMWELILIFLAVLGGIYMGIFTPTEAGAIGCLIVFLFSLIKRKINLSIVLQSLKETARITVMIFTLLIGAMIFNSFVVFSGIPEKLEVLITGLSINRYLLLALILASYFIFGCIMDAVAMAVLLLPIYYPLMISQGFDGVWFGIIVMVMAEMGLVTPPIGLNCFVVQAAVPKYQVETVFKGVLPFLVMEIAVLVILIIFPKISLFLPNLMR